MGVEKLWGENEVAEMLRLVTALCETRSGTDARRRALLEGVCKQVDAVAGALWVGVDVSGATEAVGATSITVGRDGEIGESIAKLTIDGDAADPALRKLLRRAKDRAAGTTLTHTRRQLIPDKRWYASDHIAQVRRPA